MKYGFIIACSIIASTAFCFEYSHIEQDIPQVEIDGRTASVSLADCQSAKPGEFDLPVRILNIALPPGTHAVSLDYDIVREPLAAGVEIATVRDPGYYARWPETGKSAVRPVASLINTGLIFGVPIAQIGFRPVSYAPESGTLFLNKAARFRLELEDWNIEVRESEVLTPMSASMRNRSLRSAVVNPERLPAAFEPVAMESMTSHVRSFPPVTGDDPADGVVIVDDRYLPYMDIFTDELAFGLAIEIVPVQALYDAYSEGIDRAERIRNFIVDAYVHWGISGVFFIGTIEEIPARFRYGSMAIPTWTEAPSDLYFAVMDGDWNFDGDMFFGEDEEDDFMPELFVGRFQPEDTTEVIGYCEKIRTHRRGLDPDFVRRWLFAGASLSPTGNDRMGQSVCDSLISGHLPSGIDALKMYSRADSTGGDVELNRDEFLSEIDLGRYLICHIDHGYKYFFHTGKQTGGGGLSIEDFFDMTNDPLYPILYTYSCDVNAIDITSVGAASIRVPGGGLLAIIANSRTAWTSQVLLVYHIFIYSILPFRSVKLGEIVRNTQLTISDDMVYRYYKAILTLFGYPFVDVYPNGLLDIDLAVSTDSIGADESMILATVYKTGTSAPVESVLVVARTPGGRYAMARTGSDGMTRLFLRPEDTERVYISACDRGVVFKEETLRVTGASGALVVVDEASFYEIGGDGDGLLEPGDTFACDIRIENIGVENADTIDIVVGNCGAFDSTARIFDLAAGDTATIVSGFVFEVPKSVRGKINLRPIVELISSGPFYLDTLSVQIDAPVLRRYMTDYIDGAGSMPSPGDTAAILVGVTNVGFGDFHGTEVDISIFGATAAATHYSIGTFAPEDTFIMPISLIPDGVDIGGEAVFTFSNATPETIRFARSVPAVSDSLSATSTISTIQISWHPPDDGTVIGYYVYRRSFAPGSGWGRLNRYPIKFSIYIDDGLPEKTKFYYRVTAIDEWSNEGPASDSILAWTTLPLLDGWPRSVGVSIQLYCSPVLHDWDGDGAQEIYIAGKNYSGIFAMFADGVDVYDSTSGIDPFAVLAWEGSEPSAEGIWGSPALADIDGDGSMELLVNHRDLSRKLYLLDLEDGSVETGWPRTVAMTSMGSPVIADIDWDGELDVINPTFTGIEAYRWDGSELIPGSGGIFAGIGEELAGSFWASPAVGDIDGDGKIEVVIGGPKDSLGNGTMWVFEDDGTVAPGWPVRVPWANFACCNPVLANFDSDTTTLEILATTRLRGVFIFNHHGYAISGWPIEGYYFWEFGSHCAAADFDGDNICEAVISGSYDIGIYRADGTPLPGWPKTLGNTTEYPGNATIGDIDGDGDWDLIYTLKDRIYAFDIEGNSIPGFPLITGDLCYCAPTLGDVDGDGEIEIVVGCFDSQIYVWKTGAPYTPSAIAWPTEKGNFARTGVYGDFWRIDHVEEDIPPMPDDFDISAYPNPFNSAVTISVGEGLVPFRIEIFDINGRIVAELPVTTCDFENPKVVPTPLIWQPEEKIGSGVYLVRATISDESVSKRIVYLK